MPHSNNVEQRNDAEVHGIAPMKSIDVTSYAGTTIPDSWDITGVTGDILMVEYADTAGDDDDLVMRDGLYINRGVTNAVWRVGKIIHAGPAASEQAATGAFVMFPGDKGIPMSKFKGPDDKYHSYIFINEERIFCFVKPKPKEK